MMNQEGFPTSLSVPAGLPAIPLTKHWPMRAASPLPARNNRASLEAIGQLGMTIKQGIVVNLYPQLPILPHISYLSSTNYCMRILPALLAGAVTTGLVLLLNTKMVLTAPLGKLLSPQHGVWQNAEPLDADFNASLHFPQLKGKTAVYFDSTLIPHIFAEDENDAYFVQGYLHAKFRLWQMELQTHSAAGRASEIVGPIALKHDREFRRLGMVYAAENSLKTMEADPVIKAACDNYTAGVNAYIATLTESALPIEYKLLGYKPEAWNNLKTMLFLKYMSFDLAAREDDFEMTNAKHFFTPEQFNLLFPAIQDSLDPIIPKGTPVAPPSIKPVAPASADSLYFGTTTDSVSPTGTKPNKSNGSNNWAVSGKKTKSGYPILCNDPHLKLNLPSLWYEMQISTPAFNAYGVSFPGAPGVIIGFNDSCAFGFTNGGRDVRDYFEIKFKDDTRSEYWFNGEWKKTTFRVETIRIKDSLTVTDSVAYTVFGPVMYDKTFSGGRQTNNKAYAVRWTGQDGSNEMRIFHDLNHAKNYNDYAEATRFLRTPGQNCIFAAKNGDIALRTQGNFPAKWTGQGDFVMPGTDSSYMWQGMIPYEEVPYQYNPERGFVSSANQRPVDYNYPYYLGRLYPEYRGLIVNRMLNNMNGITPEDMIRMQADNYNIFGEMARPILLKHVRENDLSADEKQYFNLLKSWDLRHDVHSKGATVFLVAWDNFADAVYKDEYAKAPKPIVWPLDNTLVEQVLKDSAYALLDDINTPQKESIADVATAAFKKAAVDLKEIEASRGLELADFKGTGVYHLLRLPAFSRLRLPIGGGENIINATIKDHGPSWRMVVHLSPVTEAYGIYPGGQSGNPGSRFFDNFVDNWVAGKPNRIWFMTKNEVKDPRVQWTMTFGK
jgi:penicillin G amidase